MFSGNANSGKKSFPTRQKCWNKNIRFRSNSHGLAKKGIFGRKTQIDEEQFSYFEFWNRCWALQRQRDRNRIFKPSLKTLCSDSFASHILQKLIQIAFLRFVDGESLNVSDHSAHKKSKVEIEQFTDEFYNRNNTFSEDHKRNCANFVLETSNYLLNNLEDIVWNFCANHIMRMCVLSLAGIYKPKKIFSESKMVDKHIRKIYNGVPSE
ncbi:hypothetical protein GQX74_013722 [Glossina fuscipes]|nr:hypothetical protein GQX74_013722 [Glossina fuscipes]